MKTRTRKEFLTCLNNIRKLAVSEYGFKIKVVVFAACLAAASSAFAQQPLAGGYTNIDPPGAAIAGAFGINNDGEIVGRYKDALANPYHAFVRDESGSYTKIDPQNALTAQAVGVNNSGSVVGYFCDTSPCGSISTYQGFLLKEGTYSSFGSPIHTNTWPSRIND